MMIVNIFCTLNPVMCTIYSLEIFLQEGSSPTHPSLNTDVFMICFIDN